MNKYLVIAIIIAFGGILLVKGNVGPIIEKTQNQMNEATTTPVQSAAREVTNRMHEVTVETNYGKFQFETFDADAPKTVQNFLELTNKGFYNGLTFHRIVPGFVIQGGDPSGNGTGGPGYKFEDELNPQTESYKMGYVKGIVAMANAGPNTNGSQFFVMLADNALPHAYTIFGKVTKGQEVVDAIGAIPSNPATGAPSKEIKMSKVSVVEK